MEEKTILIGDLRASFKMAGKGPAILILHGWGGSSDSWVRVQEMLAAKSFLVFCPDLPGFGKSITPKIPWQVSDYVNWIQAFIEFQDLNDFVLLGHSFGGRIAIKYAVRFPDKVKKLILCDAAGIKRKLGFKERIIFLLSKMGNMIFSPRPLRRFKDKARNLFYLFLRSKDYVKADRIMKETIKEVLEEDLLPYLPEIKTKTLIVWGKKDKILPLEHAHIFKDRIRHSKLKVLDNVDHSPHIGDPQGLVNVILEFL